jgi:hypothetical protein
MFSDPELDGRYLREAMEASLGRNQGSMPNTRKDMRSFVEEVRVLLTEEQDHRRREEDLRPYYEQMPKSKEKPLTEKVKEELAEAVR